MARHALLPGPVTVTVACRTSRESGAPARRHPITLQPDGSVDTPHDLEQERIMAALGGYLSCLELVDVVAPAFFAWYRAGQRLTPRLIRAKEPRGPWRAAKRASCCPARGYLHPQQAADHARSPRHVAETTGVSSRLLSQLAGGVRVELPPEVHEEPLATLWDCGIHPDRVEVINQAIGARDPMPVEFYLGVMSTNPRLIWLADTIWETEADVETATWLAWTYATQDRKDPAARTRWLNSGVIRRLIPQMMQSLYTVADVEAFAAYWELSLSGAAVVLNRWVETEVCPSVAELTGPRTAHLGFPPAAPSVLARLRLSGELGPDVGEISQTDLALALVEHGDVVRAAEALAGRR